MVIAQATFSILSAFKNLYTTHHSWLNNWLRKKMGNHFDAADLAQDTFLRVLLHEDVSKLHEPRAFLTTVASGLVSNYYRRKKLEQAYLDALLHLPVHEVPSPETKSIVLETLTEIDGLLNGLPHPVRKAFLLSQLDGMGQAEIAKELDVSISTVKRYIVRAVQQCCFEEGK